MELCEQEYVWGALWGSTPVQADEKMDGQRDNGDIVTKKFAAGLIPQELQGWDGPSELSRLEATTITSHCLHLPQGRGQEPGRCSFLVLREIPTEGPT